MDAKNLDPNARRGGPAFTAATNPQAVAPAHYAAAREAENDADYEPEDAGEGRGHWFFFMAVVLSVGVVVGGYYGLRESVQRGYMDQFKFVYDHTRLMPVDRLDPTSSEDTVQIFLSKDGKTLSPYPRRVRRNTPNPEKARLIMDELLSPTGGGALATLMPPGTQSRGFFQVGSTAFVDLSNDFLNAKQDRSPRAERLAIYAIVNSVALNIPDIQSVQILVEGNPIETAWGYMDCSTPLGPDLSLIR